MLDHAQQQIYSTSALQKQLMSIIFNLLSSEPLNRRTFKISSSIWRAHGFNTWFDFFVS